MRAKQVITSLALLVLAACVSPLPPGPTAMIAGWDFSSYFGDGALSIDGVKYTATLDANYSDLDASIGAGAGAAAFGRMYLDGEFGSTDEQRDYDGPFLPSAAARGSLHSNLDRPAGVHFDCFTALRKEGQLFANLLAMTALGASQVVFEADLSSVPEWGRNWALRFGGKTSGGLTAVEIEFSTDGRDFTGVGSVDLTEADASFHVTLGSAPSQKVWVRLGFAPDAAARQQLFIDNLSIDAALIVPATGATPLAVRQACPPEA